MPTWIFLLAWFGVILTYMVVKGNYSMVSGVTIFKYFTLQTGWYVWVMRVFLITALLSPVITGFTAKVGKWMSLIAGIAVLVLYELFHINDDGSFGYYLTMCIPYVVMFTYGAVVKEFNKRELISIAIFFLCVCLAFGIHIGWEKGLFLNTNNFKTPPLLYFSSFGIGMSMVFWLLKDKLFNLSKRLKIDKGMAFVGSHTMWFYLLHIPVVTVANSLHVCVFLKFVVTFAVTSFITVLFVRFIEDIVIKHITNESVKKNIKLVFLG